MIGRWELDSCVQYIAKTSRADLHGNNLSIENITSDSRQPCDSGLFVALRGEHHDGHAYVDQAYHQGCIAAMVDTPITAPIPYIRTDNTTYALGLLGQLNRTRFDGQIIAVTGSSGKTTMCSMIDNIFSLVKPTLATKENHNNEIGVAQTLLQLEQQHAYAVVEMGARHPGDIGYLAQLAMPQTAVIASIGQSHLATLGGLAQVAEVKAEIFGKNRYCEPHLHDQQDVTIQHGDIDRVDTTLPWAIVRATDQREYRLLDDLPDKNTGLTFGLASENADAALSDIQLAADKASATLVLPSIFNRDSTHMQIALRTHGVHQLHNAAGAALVAWVHGIEKQTIVQGLANFSPAMHRGDIRHFGKHVVCDDTYNANPPSMRAAIDTLMLYKPAYCIMVVGDMLELGESTQDFHHQIGEYAALRKVDALLTYGELTKASGYRFCHNNNKATWVVGDTHQQLAKAAMQLMQQHPQVAIMVKGSRSMHMEQVITHLQKLYREQLSDGAESLPSNL